MRQGRSNSSTGIKCHVCSREFSKNEHLKRHLRSHSKEKPYECTECKKLFVRRDTLSRHTKSHHGSVLPKKTTVKRKRAASTSGLDSLSAAVYPVQIENVRHNSVVEFFSGYTPNTITTRQPGNSPDNLFGASPNSIAAAAALAAVPQPGNSSQMVNSNPLNLQGPLSSSVLVDQLISDSDGLNEYLEFLAHNFDEVAVFPESNNHHVSSSSPVPPPTLWALETSSTSSSSGGDSPLTLSSSLDSASDTFSIDEALSPKSRKPTSVDLQWPPVFDFESDELYPRDGHKRRIVDDPLTTLQGISW
ncbi:hypothetical protein TRVA0_007S00166 [Trichomonascus vanleenenianus]|uniref:uncharacterized protein n=1 Tax=Trichomonascus vanleenenianus TaxID=2268995 RepID=UPI003EC9DBFB